MKLLLAFLGICSVLFFCPLVSLAGNTGLASLLFIGGIACIGAGIVQYLNGSEGENCPTGRPQQPVEAKTGSPSSDTGDIDPVLVEIQRLNDAIPDPVMSQKIDRVKSLTGLILTHRKAHPESDADLSMFLNYYLPTTLKLLRAYAQLDAQGIDSENIKTTKGNIQQMMDNVITGFETQLDKLLAGSMLDINTDIQVMERSLRANGLLPDEGLTMTGGGT